MVATVDLIKLRRHRRIVWYVIFAFLFLGIVLASLGYEGAGPIAFLIFLTLLYALQLGSRIRRAENEQTKLTAKEEIKLLNIPLTDTQVESLAKLMAKEEIKLQPYWKILAGNLLFAGFVLLMCSSSILLANLSALVVIGVLLPMAVSAGKEPCGLRRQRWTRLAIYAIAVSVGWMLDHQASEKEQRSYDSIIAAVEQYKAIEKRYPDTLEQLAPKYLAAVPTGRWGKFMYFANNPDDAHLSHMPMPPVKESYNFKSKTSKTWD